MGVVRSARPSLLMAVHFERMIGGWETVDVQIAWVSVKSSFCFSSMSSNWNDLLTGVRMSYGS